MNIFAFTECPNISARLIDDKRCIKMVLETAQMLSTAINFHGGVAPYKSTHVNHPCNVWTRKTRGNYLWLLDYFMAISQEYTRRYGKVHKCAQYLADFELGAAIIPVGMQTAFVNCARNNEKGVDYTHINDVHLAYQMYMDERFATDIRPPTWR